MYLDEDSAFLYYGKKWGKRILIWIRNVILLFFVLSLFSVVLYRYIPVKLTPLMLIRLCEQSTSGKSLSMRQKWVPIENISHNMIQAVIASEDNRFLTHSGFDFEAIKKAEKMNEKGKGLYGASTISQQTAKNLFLWPGRSWLRKGLEVYFTFLLEKITSKKRIMELYLNVVELGEGIYGVEYASNHYYRHSAKIMTTNEAAKLAVCLPLPLKRNPNNLSSKMQHKKNRIENLMKKVDRTDWGFGNTK